jgi:PTH1 family peptidyl-tRNA hydrolase
MPENGGERYLVLLVGLGNPGERYERTRHNAGAWFVERCAQALAAEFRREARLKGRLATLELDAQPLKLFLPDTYMNESGEAVGRLLRYFKLPPEKLLVAHDELDLPPGAARLKQGGGDGGHNGLKDIVAHLGSNAFWRLRLGIGHPGNAREVVDYVLKRPSAHDQERIHEACDAACGALSDILHGRQERAMNVLHAIGKTSSSKFNVES